MDAVGVQSRGPGSQVEPRSEGLVPSDSERARSSMDSKRDETQQVERFGALFCGGASRRMGRDKALLEWRGQPLLMHGVEVLRASCASVFLAPGPEARYAEFGLPSALDRQPGLGPLAGLEAALSRAVEQAADPTRALLCVLACDMPHASALVFDALFAGLGEADACLLRGPSGQEPLFAVYRLGVLAHVRAALDQGARRMDSFHPAIKLAYVDAESLPPAAYASNWNTLEDYREGERS